MLYMHNYYDLIKVEKRHQLILGVVFILYLLLDAKTPESVAKYIDTPLGNIIVAIVAISTFYHSNPIVGILGLVVAYELVRRSKDASRNSFLINRVLSNESSKFKTMEKLNVDKNAVSLEEEMVEKMAPLVKYDVSSNTSYKPILDTFHDAAPIDYDGVA
jgi:hypothetical protein